jgi:hypothetical protein
MDMKKKLLLSTLFSLFFIANVHGDAQRVRDPESTSGLEKIKFGVHSALVSKGGVFVEYQVHEALGLRTGCRFFENLYLLNSLQESSDRSAIVSPSYLSVPLITRWYPGTGRQFCMFVGLQVGYLIGGNIAYIPKYSKNKEMMATFLSQHRLASRFIPEEAIPNLKQSKRKIKDKSKQIVTINNWRCQLFVGMDYEYLGGFQLGLECSSELSSLAACEEKKFDGTFRISLGFNFAKFLAQRVAS